MTRVDITSHSFYTRSRMIRRIKYFIKKTSDKNDEARNRMEQQPENQTTRALCIGIRVKQSKMIPQIIIVVDDAINANP